MSLCWTLPVFYIEYGKAYVFDSTVTRVGQKVALFNQVVALSTSDKQKCFQQTQVLQFIE